MSTSPPDSPAAPLQQARILIVDDDPTVLQAHGRLLAGYQQLRFATTAEQAMQQLRDWRPQLLLLDLEMPGMGGLELLQQLRQQPEEQRLPVIIVTQHVSAALETAVFEQGAADFVTKPVAGPALRARVAMHLRLSQLQPASAPSTGLDAETGVAGSRQFEQLTALTWQQLRPQGRALGLLLASLDSLEAVRRTQGPQAASLLMRAFARLLQALALPHGEHVGRQADAVLALLLPDADAQSAGELARRIGEGTRWLSTPQSGEAAARSTVGIGLLPAGSQADGPEAIGALRDAAQQALAQAREGGPALEVVQPLPGAKAPPPTAAILPS